MKRVPHREKPANGPVRMPRYWVMYDTETTLIAYDETYQEQQLKMGWAVYWDRLTDMRDWFFFTKVEDFWSFIDSKLPASNAELNLIAHNAAFDLRVMNWYHNLFEVGNWERGKVTILPDGSPLPFVVQLKRGRERIMLRDLANYYGLQPLGNIGKSVGLGKQDDIVNYKTEPDRWFNAEVDTDDWELLKVYCRRDTEIVLKAMDVLMTFLETHQLGSLSISAASQSKLAFRKFMPVEKDGNGVLYYHTEESRMKLERDSYMGGRVEIFGKHGHVEGPIREFDFNSMYPSVQLDNLYPVKAIRGGWGYRNEAKSCTKFITYDTVSDLYSRDICIVARVTVDIPFNVRTHIPLKHDGKLLFPTGTFQTVLTTPELLYALEQNYVIGVQEYSLYSGRRDLFTDYVEFFYAQRVAYKSEGNKAFEQLCKLFMNSLYGKFGQYSHEWEIDGMPEGVVPPGMVMKIGDKTYRNFGHITEVRSPRMVEPSNSFAAIASHVTAYGRDILRQAMDVVSESVVYCDTDSIHVKGNAWKGLDEKGFIHPSRLGALAQEDHKGDNAPSDWGIYLAPKDYLLDGKTAKLKGIPKDAQEVEPGMWLTTQMQGLSGAFRQGNIDVVLQRPLIKRRHDGYTKGFVRPDSTIIPWHFHKGVLITESELYNGY